jgi:hypothetical protein
VASKKTLNAKNLEALGVARLAEIMLEISAGNANVKRRLRLELAGAHSTDDLAREIRKRMSTIARSRTFVDWSKRKALIEDLETQLRAIVVQVTPHDPAEALDLMWRFLALANSIFERCDDSSGSLINIFHRSCEILGEIAEAASPEPAVLADQIFLALQENHYGQYDDMIMDLAPAMGIEGLDLLKERMTALSKAPTEVPEEGDREVIGWSSSGPIYADEIVEHSRVSTVRLALKQIADAQGDVDAFIAQYDDETKTVPGIAAEIAQRLLAAGRVDEAWEAINAARIERSGWANSAWENTRIVVLESLGRTEEAQADRWSCFERTLSKSHLREYLKNLSDFDDVEAEQRAIEFVMTYPSAHQALAFLIEWPALEKAATLVLRRRTELDGDHYEILTPAADALSAKHPLAATLLLRAMIDFALSRARSSRYRHAARHLADCEGLAAAITEFGEIETHDDYVSRLRQEHRRKSGFWGRVEPSGSTPRDNGSLL